jgi:hypothetical protein
MSLQNESECPKLELMPCQDDVDYIFDLMTLETEEGDITI